MADPTFLWYDLETYGFNFTHASIVQFASIRTDANLNKLDETNILCRPPPDLDIEPDSVKIHKISPLRALAEGIKETEFAGRLYEELSRPGTCSVGYNSINFDNKFMRFLFFRNFLPAYWHEFKNGCSKWDLFNLTRMIALLRPEVLNIAEDEPMPSFSLANIARRNDFAHDNPHDALSDVGASLDLARKIKEQSPEWYEYFFSLRYKDRVMRIISAGDSFLYVTEEHLRRDHRVALVVPIIPHPIYSTYSICLDLRYSVNMFHQLSAKEINHRYFGEGDNNDNLPTKLGLIMVKINKCPAIVPWQEVQRHQLDTNRILDVLKLSQEAVYTHLDEFTQEKEELASKLQEAFSMKPDREGDTNDSASSGGIEDSKEHLSANDNTARCADASAKGTIKVTKKMEEAMLYDGFVHDDDIATGMKIRNMGDDELTKVVQSNLPFKDSRLNKIVLRYKGRNYYESMSAAEQDGWMKHLAEHFNNTLPARIAQVQELLQRAEEDEKLPLQETFDYFRQLTRITNLDEEPADS